ncbi:MAG: hypothetical protein LUF92_09130 [Clostridiales bacterium]|nr:hypothetical protein [Clostridiales bacterium]
MDKRKRLIIIVLVVVIVLAAIVGAVTYFVRNSKDSTVDVFSMELLNSSGWFYDDEEISGTVTSDYVQEVYADSSETVKKVYVEEGDTVEVGDKLLKYDVEEQQLDVKLQKLQIQSMKLDIEDLEKELEELKNTKTVGAVDSSGSALLSASANLSSLKSSVTVSLLRADADDDTGESSGTTEDTSGTTEEGSGTTATTEESSGTTATTADISGTT